MELVTCTFAGASPADLTSYWSVLVGFGARLPALDDLRALRIYFTQRVLAIEPVQVGSKTGQESCGQDHLQSIGAFLHPGIGLCQLERSLAADDEVLDLGVELVEQMKADGLRRDVHALQLATQNEFNCLLPSHSVREANRLPKSTP